MTFIEHKISISSFLFALFFALIEWIKLNNQDSAFQPYRRCLGFFFHCSRNNNKIEFITWVKICKHDPRQPPSMLVKDLLSSTFSFFSTSVFFTPISSFVSPTKSPKWIVEKIEKGKLGNESTRSISAQVFHNRIYSTQTNLTSSSIFPPLSSTRNDEGTA